MLDFLRSAWLEANFHAGALIRLYHSIFRFFIFQNIFLSSPPTAVGRVSDKFSSFSSFLVRIKQTFASSSSNHIFRILGKFHNNFERTIFPRLIWRVELFLFLLSTNSCHPLIQHLSIYLINLSHRPTRTLASRRTDLCVV